MFSCNFFCYKMCQTLFLSKTLNVWNACICVILVMDTLWWCLLVAIQNSSCWYIQNVDLPKQWHFLHLASRFFVLLDMTPWFRNVSLTVTLFDFLGNYILNYFITRPKLAPFVIQALAQVSTTRICNTERYVHYFRFALYP